MTLRTIQQVGNNDVNSPQLEIDDVTGMVSADGQQISKSSAGFTHVRPGRKMWGIRFPENGGTTTIIGVGAFKSVNSTTDTGGGFQNAVLSTDHLLQLPQRCGVNATNFAWLSTAAQTGASFWIVLNQLPYVEYQVNFPSFLSITAFTWIPVVLTDTAGGSIFNSNGVANSGVTCVGLRCNRKSPTAETTWHVFVQNASSQTQSVYDTGISVDNNFHNFGIDYDGVNFNAWIDGVVVYTITPADPHFPLAAALADTDVWTAMSGFSASDGVQHTQNFRSFYFDFGISI